MSSCPCTTAMSRGRAPVWYATVLCYTRYPSTRTHAHLVLVIKHCPCFEKHLYNDSPSPRCSIVQWRSPVLQRRDEGCGMRSGSNPAAASGTGPARRRRNAPHLSRSRTRAPSGERAPCARARARQRCAVSCDFSARRRCAGSAALRHLPRCTRAHCSSSAHRRATAVSATNTGQRHVHRVGTPGARTPVFIAWRPFVRKTATAASSSASAAACTTAAFSPDHRSSRRVTLAINSVYPARSAQGGGHSSL